MAYMSVDMWHLEETNHSDIIIIVLYSKFTLLLHILFLTMAPLAIASYNSNVYLLLLDVSKAFDRIQF